MQLNEAVATRIREICKARGMSQYQLYLASGVPQSTLSTIMSCTFPSAKLRIIYEVAKALALVYMNFLNLRFLHEKT